MPDKVGVFATTGTRRSSGFPDIPTVAESGVPSYAFENWHAIVLPANTPREVVQRLHAELVKGSSQGQTRPSLSTDVEKR